MHREIVLMSCQRSGLHFRLSAPVFDMLSDFLESLANDKFNSFERTRVVQWYPLQYSMSVEKSEKTLAEVALGPAANEPADR